MSRLSRLRKKYFLSSRSRWTERIEGSAFLLGFQETADSSGKSRPSECHGRSFSAACESATYKDYLCEGFCGNARPVAL